MDIPDRRNDQPGVATDPTGPWRVGLAARSSSPIWSAATAISRWVRSSECDQMTHCVGGLPRRLVEVGFGHHIDAVDLGTKEGDPRLSTGTSQMTRA